MSSKQNKKYENIIGSDNSGNRQQASIGQLVLGEITVVNIENGTCTVKTYSPSNLLEGCVWLTKSFTSPLLGYRVKSLPSEGTKVMVLVGNPSFIVGIVDNPQFDERFALSMTKDGEFTREEVLQNEMYKGFEPPASMLEGEFEIENAFNVGMSFLTNLITMHAGDRAKVEAHLLQDMIRVIAEQYHVVTPLGEMKIYDDGRPNMELLYGNYVHELLNLASPNQSKVDNAGHHVNFDALANNDPINSFGHRFKAYIGFVGNFINMFVSDPISNLGALASGKAHIHVGNSGDILLRTVSEIALERVVRIVSPVRLKKKNEQGAFLSDAFDKLENSDALKKWEYGSAADLHQTAYSLRSYARYLSNFASLMRFHQMEDKTFSVPSENQLPIPDMHHRERDITSVNEPSVFLEGYSTIRIFRDGSVLSMDNEGGAVYHGRGIVEISAVKDIRLEAARDISIVAGRHFFVRSRQNMEFASSEGGIVFKARKLINALCEQGKIWIKSDSRGVGDENGVVIDAAQANLVLHSKKDMLIQQEEGDLTVNTVKGESFIGAKKDIVISSSNGSVFTKAAAKVAVKAKDFFAEVNNFNVFNKFIISGRNVFIKATVHIFQQLKCKRSIFGPARATRHRTRRGDSVPGRYNHIEKIGKEFIKAPVDSIQPLKSKERSTQRKSQDKLKKFLTQFWELQKHRLNLPADGSRDALFIPYAQDFLETNGGDGYSDWNITEDFILPEDRTSPQQLPWPTSDVKEENHADFAVGESLNKPSIRPSKEWEKPQIKTRKIKRKVAN